MPTPLVVLILVYLPPLAGLGIKVLYVVAPLIRFFLKSFLRWDKRKKEIFPFSLGDTFLFSLLRRINLFLGVMEYYTAAPRNFFAGVALLGSAGMKLFQAAWQGLLPMTVLIDLFFVGVTFYSIHRIIIVNIKMTEFLRAHPRVHPHDFFSVFYSLLAPRAQTVPLAGFEEVSPENVSFKKHKRPAQKWGILLHILTDTAHLAHASLRSLRYVGKDFAREVFDVMAQMWGKRLLELTHSSLTVKGVEQINNLSGKILLVSNHKSQIDFVLTFFALSSVRLPSGRGIRPRFITARDHFVDNYFVYEIMGVGKLIETVDMVFIERTRKASSFEDLNCAALFLAGKEIDIAIYPQGTRAPGNNDRSGKRRDAGYYTTVPPRDISKDRGHLRKGTAHLALDTLLELATKGRQELHLVFLGIRGTGTMMPKGSFSLQTETDVEYEIGSPLTLSTDFVEGMVKPVGLPQNEAEEAYLKGVEELQQKIDGHLAACMGIHEVLWHRFLMDLQGYFRYTSQRIRQVEESFKALAAQGSLGYQIVDRIYACPTAQWNAFLAQFAELLMEGLPLDRLKHLRDQVTRAMLAAGNTKLHGKKVKKELLTGPLFI